MPGRRSLRGGRKSTQKPAPKPEEPEESSEESEEEEEEPESEEACDSRLDTHAMILGRRIQSYSYGTPRRCGG